MSEAQQQVVGSRGGGSSMVRMCMMTCWEQVVIYYPLRVLQHPPEHATMQSSKLAVLTATWCTSVSFRFRCRVTLTPSSLHGAMRLVSGVRASKCREACKQMTGRYDLHSRQRVGVRQRQGLLVGQQRLQLTGGHPFVQALVTCEQGLDVITASTHHCCVGHV